MVDEYQRYAGSEAWQRDKAFWQAQRQALPAPASLSAAPLGGRAAGSDIWRMKLEMNADAFRRRPAMRRSVSPLTWRWRSPRCGWAACATGWTTRRALSLCAGWVQPR
nr:Enterobactin synthase component F [Klebsiella pneumoniae]